MSVNQAEGALAAVRAREFAAAARWTYLDHASDSPLPERSARVIAERVALLQDPLLTVPPREGYLEAASRRLGRMLHANPAQFAYLTNISDATATIANGIDWRPGDEVVLLAGEFASFVYPWRTLEARGVRPIFVEKTGVATDLGLVEAAMSSRTRVVAVSHVEFQSGFRNDLATLAGLAHARDALFMVDASQSLGVLDLDVERDGIDALAAVGYKWLMAPHGISVLFVSEAAQERIRPTMPGRTSVEAGWQTEDYALRWLPDARRYQGGALNWIGVCALAESLGLLEEIGTGPVQTAALALTDALVEGLETLPVTITSDLRAEHRSSIVTFTFGSTPVDDDCVATGRDRGIAMGRRGFGVRVGAHCWNDETDIAMLLDHVREVAQRHGGANR